VAFVPPLREAFEINQNEDLRCEEMVDTLPAEQLGENSKTENLTLGDACSCMGPLLDNLN